MRPISLAGKILCKFQRRHGCCAAADFVSLTLSLFFVSLLLVVCSWLCGLGCKELMLLWRSLCRKYLRKPRPCVLQKKVFLLLFCNALCVCLAYSPNKQVQVEEQIFTPPAKEKEIPAVTPFSKIQLAANKRLQAAEQNGKGGQKKKKVDGNKGKGKTTKVDGKGTQTKKKGKGKGAQTKKKGDGKDTQTKKKGKGNGDKAGMSICDCMLLHMFWIVRENLCCWAFITC